MNEPVTFDQPSCPVPRSDYQRVLLGHGSGGKLTADLIEHLFVAELGNEVLVKMEDAATLSIPNDPTPVELRQTPCSGTLSSEAKDDSGHDSGHDRRASRIAFTTDSFVVKPLFFPGGDIGKLAVHGTVNDLAVSGATPLYLSAAFVLEEGFEMDKLRRIVVSMRQACAEAGVSLVTGDTKVVDRGKGDEVFITTSGVGVVPHECCLSVQGARPGDRILVSGSIGDHGMAIMSAREGLEFETTLVSDTAPLNGLTKTMLEKCPSIRVMRDPTRGGLSSTLNEIAGSSQVGIRLDESALPVRDEVHAACEMLGMDPMHVANEGKLIAVVSEADADFLLQVMQSHPLGKDAAIIGEITDEHAGMVVMRSLIGGLRVVTMLTGEQLPRIC